MEKLKCMWEHVSSIKVIPKGVSDVCEGELVGFYMKDGISVFCHKHAEILRSVLDSINAQRYADDKEPINYILMDVVQ